MPVFTATVIDPLGRRRALVDDATDAAQLRARLRARHLWPLHIEPARPDRRLARLRLPTRAFVELLHQLELQLRAGITADAALTQLAADTPPGPARTMLEQIEREVRAGRPIHEACRFFGRQFPPHLAAIIAAGEASARLPAALGALAHHLSEMDELGRTARRALIYPAMVLAAVLGLAAFLLAVVIPQFAEIFSSLSLRLPAATVLLIEASNRVRTTWLPVVSGAGTTAAAIWLALRTPHGRLVCDRVLLRLPLLGDIIRHLATARFAAHVGLLHEAGIPLLEALRTGADLTGQAVLAAQLRMAREAVAAGRPLSAALPPDHGFPAFIVPTLRAGETSGQLGDALRHIETYAASRARARLLTALTLLEPALIVLLTSIVGFTAFSFFLPLMQLLGGLNPR
jgi:type II secretory pathway component PulF